MPARRPRLAALALGLGLLAACAQAPVTTPTTAPIAAAAPAAPVHLRLIAFNDFHGHLESGSLSLTQADPAQPGATLRVPVGGAAARLRRSGPWSAS